MMNYNRLHHLFLTPALAIAAAIVTLTSCTTVDETIGSNLIPDNQQMKAGYTTLPIKGELNPKKYVETRLFQTDSVISSNLGYGYMGATLNDTTGLTAMGFMSQYVSYYRVDSGYFGFRPMYDSALLMLSIKSYGLDTITPQKYNVYEVISNNYLVDKSPNDTTFYLSFNPKKEGIIGKDVLFSFTFPNPKSNKGPATTVVTLTPEQGADEFISRLMLQSGKYKGDYSIYSFDSLSYWVEEFKGLYVVPDEDPTIMGKGGMYATDLSASGLAVYGRNRVKEDPSLIKDTIGMEFYFYYSDLKENYGKVSINTLRRDFSKASSAAKLSIDDARETNENRPTNNRIYVEGMSGVVSEITMTQEFFNALEAELAKEMVDGKPKFSNLAFSQVRMMVYFTDSNYDWTMIDPTNPGRLLDEMSSAQVRLGLYTNFKTLTPIADYYYAYEKQSDTKLPYGGRINRSRGCYVMDITSHAQTLWKSYLKEKMAADKENRAIDISKVEKRTIYLAPEAYGLYSAGLTVAQGMPTDETAATKNHAPIRFEFTYNMIK